MAGAAGAAISVLAGDLAVAVGYGIAAELQSALAESQFSEEELIAIVLSLGVILSSLPRLLGDFWREARRCARSPQDEKPTPRESPFVGFIQVLISLAQRLAQSVAVQLLAANVRANSNLRGVRVLSLIAVAVFFVFLEHASTLERVQRHPSPPHPA